MFAAHIEEMRNHISSRPSSRLDLASPYGLEVLKNSEKMRVEKIAAPRELDGALALADGYAVALGSMSSPGRKR